MPRTYSRPVKRGRQTIPVAPSVKRYVKRCTSRLIEKKCSNVNAVLTMVGTGTPQVSADLLANIMQGDSMQARTGNHIRITRLTIRVLVLAKSINVIRFAYVWDTQANGAAPAWTDVFDSTSTASTYNGTNVAGAGGSRFHIIADRTVTAEPQIAGTYPYKSFLLSFRPNKVVSYKSNGGTVADMLKNNFIILCNDVNGTTTGSVVNSYVQFCYEDA